MALEVETKFKLDSPDKIRKALKKLGAKFISKTKEKDAYYKNPKAKNQKETIRLRTTGKDAIFAIKLPVGEDKKGKYKIREELEIDVKNSKLFDIMIKNVGFKLDFRKEKFRETYKWKDAVIAIDKLPFLGYYLEVEASKSVIKKITKLLNLDMNKASSLTYMDIFEKYKKLNKKPKLKLIF